MSVQIIPAICLLAAGFLGAIGFDARFAWGLVGLAGLVSLVV